MDNYKFIDDPKENRRKLKRWLHEENKKVSSTPKTLTEPTLHVQFKPVCNPA